MPEDLYTPSQNTPAVDNTQVNSTSFDLNGGSPFNVFGFDPGVVLYYANVFTLAWTIFYTLLMVAEFYYYRVLYPDMEIAREKQGVEALQNAINMWWAYLFCLALFWVYTATNAFWSPVIGYAGILAYFCKVVLADLPNIPVLNNFLGAPGSKVGEFVDGFFKEGQKFIIDLLTYAASLFSTKS